MPKKRIGIYIDSDMWEKVRAIAFQSSDFDNRISASKWVENLVKKFFKDVEFGLTLKPGEEKDWTGRQYGVKKPIKVQEVIFTPNLGAMGVVQSDSIPDDEVHFRDKAGKLVGGIVNLKPETPAEPKPEKKSAADNIREKIKSERKGNLKSDDEVIKEAQKLEGIRSYSKNQQVGKKGTK